MCLMNIVSMTLLGISDWSSRVRAQNSKARGKAFVASDDARTPVFVDFNEGLMKAADIQGPISISRRGCERETRRGNSKPESLGRLVGIELSSSLYHP